MEKALQVVEWNKKWVKAFKDGHQNFMMRFLVNDFLSLQKIWCSKLTTKFKRMYLLSEKFGLYAF